MMLLKKILPVFFVVLVANVAVGQRTILMQSGGITRTELQDSTENIRQSIPRKITGDTIPALTVGNLSSIYPGYTYTQLKTIRLANWESFQSVCNYVIANGGRVVLPASRIEMHVNDTETIAITSNAALTIKGAGKAVTGLYFYPVVKSYDVNIFTMTATGTSIYVSDLSIDSKPFELESYNATLRPGGVANQIQITDSRVYSNTGSNFVGKTIYAAKDAVTTPSPSFTVSSYNSSTKTLTLSSNLTGISDNDAGFIGIAFLEDTPYDSVTYYGQYWLKNSVEWYFINATQASNSVDGNIVFENIKSTGFDVTVFRSSGDITLSATGCYFQGHHGAIFWYSNNETDNRISLTDCTLENNSFEVFAYVDAAFTASNLYGSAVYSHPNTQWFWTNVNVQNNNAAAVRQYSSGGGKPTPSYASSHLVGCRFVNNDEYALQTSQDMPVFFDNCYFEGTAYFNGATYINNSKFKDAVISTYESNTDLMLSNTRLTNSRFSMQYGHIVNIEGCTIETKKDVATFGLSAIEKFICRNTRILASDSTLGVGISLFGYYFNPEMVIENCQFEDTSCPVFYRFGPDTNTSFEKADYKPVQFKNCTFAASLVASSQFVFYNNMNLENCSFGSSQNTGHWQIKPILSTYKPTISGSTVSLNLNYNSYYTSGSITKINAPSVGFSGIIYLTAVAATTLTAYANPGNTGSNMDFSHTLAAGESIAMMFNPLDIRSASTTAVTGEVLRATTSGVKVYSMWGNIDFGANIVKPGTVTITIGGVTLTDDGQGNLTGTGGSGWIGYDTNFIVIYLDADPGVTNILMNYSYHNTLHQQGMWTKIN